MDNYQPPKIGKNIMRYRKLKNISLDELAKRSGVSKSMLSQIEQEKTNATIITVWKIARSLYVSIEDLLESGNDSSVEVLRREDASIIYSEDKSCVISVNSPIHMTDNLELYQMQFKPRGILSSMPHFPNAEEFLTVFEGQFKITSDGQSETLNKGDTGRYKADVKHSIENLTDSNALAYLVVWFPK